MRQGPSVRTHFAHKSLKDCDYSSENESQEHLENKEVLYHWLKRDSEVQLEYPLPELKQIADVFVNGNLALEVQCSPLPQKVLDFHFQRNNHSLLGICGQNGSGHLVLDANGADLHKLGRCILPSQAIL